MNNDFHIRYENQAWMTHPQIWEAGRERPRAYGRGGPWGTVPIASACHSKYTWCEWQLRRKTWYFRPSSAVMPSSSSAACLIHSILFLLPREYGYWKPSFKKVCAERVMSWCTTYLDLCSPLWHSLSWPLWHAARLLKLSWGNEIARQTKRIIFGHNLRIHILVRV